MSYKKQHYVPVGYLRNFSTDQGKRNRSSKVHRFSSTDRNWEEVKAKKECYGDHHYSGTDPEGAEKDFHPAEQDFAVRVDRALEKGLSDLDTLESGDMIVVLAMMFVRAAAHQNSTGIEEIQATRYRFSMVLSLMADVQLPEPVIKEDAPQTEEERRFVAGMKKWSLHEVAAPAEQRFITSDRPVIPGWVQSDGVNGHSRNLVFVVPMSPAVCWVVAHEGVEVTSGTATDADVRVLHTLVAQSANDAVYADAALTDASTIEDGLDHPHDLDSRFHDGGWEFKPATLPELSFLRRRVGNKGANTHVTVKSNAKID